MRTRGNARAFPVSSVTVGLVAVILMGVAGSPPTHTALSFPFFNFFRSEEPVPDGVTTGGESGVRYYYMDADQYIRGGRVMDDGPSMDEPPPDPFPTTKETPLIEDDDSFIVPEYPDAPTWPEEPAQPVPPPAEPSSTPTTTQCVGDGLQVCRCYCRTDIPLCENNRVSVSSLPLCPVQWSSGNCPSIGYFMTGMNAASCVAKDGQACEGYIRPGDTPGELSNLKVQGRYLGCQIVALPKSS